LRSALKSRIIKGVASYDEVVAANIRAARSRAGIGQERLAARMRALGYTAWLRQTVSKTEKNERRLPVSEVIALSYALETTTRALLQPTDDYRMVELPGGSIMAARSFMASVRGIRDGAIRWQGDSPVFVAMSYLTDFDPDDPEADWSSGLDVGET
jgi:transcriptional regulator with XRE-family HTH domain